jgi:hypothetical protein
MNYNTLSLREKEEIIGLAAQAGAQIAFKKFEEITKQEKQKRSDLRLHRTDLLMRHYRSLQKHCTESISDKKRLKEHAIDILDEIDNYIDDDLYIDSIRKSTQKTIIIVNHIKRMVDVYGLLVEKSKDPIQLRRFTAMRMRYVDESMPNIQHITQYLKIDRSVVYDDIKIAFDLFSPLLFGVDGLKFK